MMRKFKRFNLTGATQDYFLQVGEEAYISFSNATSVPLRIATQDGTYYEMYIIPSNTGGTSGGVGAPIYLYPNNTTYSGVFYYPEVFRNASGFGSGCPQHDAFRIGWALSCIAAWITNKTQYKNVRGMFDAYSVSSAYPSITAFSTGWRDTTTAWTSLGTVVFPQSTSGEILVRRLK